MVDVTLAVAEDVVTPEFELLDDIPRVIFIPSVEIGMYFVDEIMSEVLDTFTDIPSTDVIACVEGVAIIVVDIVADIVVTFVVSFVVVTLVIVVEVGVVVVVVVVVGSCILHRFAIAL